MINFISAIEELNFGDSLIILLLGMVVIFVTLSVLIGCLMVIRHVVATIEKPKKVAAPQAEVKATDVDIQEDEETVAAITAAIACILQDEAKGEEIVAPFKIKKIKHIH